MNLGDLKPGWRRYRFEQLAVHVNDRVDDPKTSGVERYVGLEHLDPESLKIRRWGTPDDVEAQKLRFQPGDIIFGKRRAYQRKLAVADFEGICSAHAMVLRARSNVVLPEFLPFFMQSDVFMERAQQISVGSLSPTINWKTLAAEEFALPPLGEQGRMVEVLGAVDKFAAELEGMQFHLERARAAYLESIFGGTHRVTGSLADLANIRSGGTPDRSRSDYWAGAIPWLSPKDMKQRQIVDTEEHITDTAVTNGAKLAPSGSIFVVVRGMILAHTFPVCRADIPMAFNQDVKAITPNGRGDLGFLQAWFEWAAPHLLRKTATTTHGTKRLETDQLLSIPIPLLSIEQQIEFCEPVHAIDKSVEGIRERCSRNRAMRHSILLSL